MIGDDWENLVVVNDHLAFVRAGNNNVERSLLANIAVQMEPGRLCTDDLRDMIGKFYLQAAVAGDYNMLMLPFCCLIAGRNRDGAPSLIHAGNFRGRFDAREVPAALYPMPQEIQQIYRRRFAKNDGFSYRETMAKRIYEISARRHRINAAGDKWIYDTVTQRGHWMSF